MQPLQPHQRGKIKDLQASERASERATGVSIDGKKRETVAQGQTESDDDTSTMWYPVLIQGYGCDKTLKSL